jgi:D-sedoheptulose 7-phosphate isomerase
VLIVLLSSGKSKNILRVLQKTKEMGITSITLLGKSGGQAVSMADFSIVIESDETERIQEIHLLLGHTFC